MKVESQKYTSTRITFDYDNTIDGFRSSFPRWGWIGIPHLIGNAFGHLPNLLEHWLEHSIVKVNLHHASSVVEVSLMGISMWPWQGYQY